MSLSSDNEDGHAEAGPAAEVMAGPSSTNTRPEEDGAPRYPIASRGLSAVEIPAVVQNVDRAIKAFGRVSSLTHVSPFPSSCANATPHDRLTPSLTDTRPCAKVNSSLLESRESILQPHHVSQRCISQRCPQSDSPQKDGTQEEARVQRSLAG